MGTLRWDLETRITYRDWREIQEMLESAYRRGRLDGMSILKDRIDTEIISTTSK